MRNSNAFLIGFTVGAAIGVVVATVTLKAYFSRECDEKVESVKERYEGLAKTVSENTAVMKSNAAIIESNSVIVANIDKPNPAKSVAELHELSQITDYNGYAKLVRTPIDAEKADVVVTDEPDPETYDVHIDDIDDEDLDTLYPTEEDPYPEEIDEDDYDGNPEFEKIELLYYAMNDVLADENDEAVPKAFVGEENLNVFTERQEHQIFVRNRGTGADYCVTLVNGKWTGDD